MKQSRPPNMPPSSSLGISVGLSSGVTVRPSSRSYHLHEEGDYICSVCERKFPSKGGLTKHMSLVHTEGTFREEGFQCQLCPRLLLVQKGLTMHLRNEHTPDSDAPTCPHCASVFPGLPTLKLHLAQSHPINDKDFPAPCRPCVLI